MRKVFTAVCAILGFAITASSPIRAHAEDDKLDNVFEPLKSCDLNDVRPAMEGILIVSWREGTKICETTVTSLGRPIPQGVFRILLKASGFLHVKGAGDTDKIAYQLAEIIDARGLNEPKRMKDTVDIAFRAYVGSNGRVTPKDLNVAIRKSGYGPTMSDDSMLTIAAMISVQKRNNGE